MFFSLPADARESRSGGATAPIYVSSTAGTNPSNNTVVEGGVEITPSSAFLSDDRKTIYVDIKLKNRNDDDILAMTVGVESAFIMENIAETPKIAVTGMKDCVSHAGNTASTWLCSGDQDIRWTKLDRDRLYSARLSATFTKPIRATLVDVNLRLLLKGNEKANAYDLSLVGIDIR